MKTNPTLPLVLMVVMQFSLIAQAETSTVQRKILPYLQAEGENILINVQIKWVNSNKLLYQTSLDYSVSPYESLPDKDITNEDKIGQVQLFDTDSNRSQVYKKGHLLNTQDEIVTIVIKKVHSKDESIKSYDELFQGPFGAEQLITKYEEKDVKKLKRCPNDNDEIFPENTIPRLLKPEHGCIRAAWSPYNDSNGTHTYFRADGKKITFELPAEDSIAGSIWIDWLQAYIFGDHITKRLLSGSPDPLTNNPTMKIFYPSGDLKIVEMGEFGLTHIRPTRAGMVAAKNLGGNKPFMQKENGLYLWRNGQKYQITEGNVARAEVSPDGCKVAFYMEYKIMFVKGSSANLRVVDVCKGFEVAKDANPFLITE